MKRSLIAASLAVAFGLPVGWVASMFLTPVLWDLEPILHMELAGHSGPSDWVFYVVWSILIPILFVAFRRLIRFSTRNND